MKIGIVGKFKQIHDEEYIARSFESLGHEVIRFEQNDPDVKTKINFAGLDLLLFTKWNFKKEDYKMKTVCWLFDLYWDYPREELIKDAPFFKADYVFTTDGGHEERWKELGINHKCVRQGIYEKECYVIPPDNPDGIAFVGSENPLYPQRTQILSKLAKDFTDFRWYGRKNPDSVRGMELNLLFSRKKIIVGDSVHSPYYWSNRIVETLGRGGFLIHREVEGLKEEYPYLVTYDGTYEDLKTKIDYYLVHEDERLDIIKKNHEWVKEHYLMPTQCQKLLNYIS